MVSVFSVGAEVLQIPPNASPVTVTPKAVGRNNCQVPKPPNIPPMVGYDLTVCFPLNFLFQIHEITC